MLRQSIKVYSDNYNCIFVNAKKSYQSSEEKIKKTKKTVSIIKQLIKGKKKKKKKKKKGVERGKSKGKKEAFKFFRVYILIDLHRLQKKNFLFERKTYLHKGGP